MADQAPDYSHFYTMAGAEHGVDPDLLRAQADVESQHDRFAVSPAGAQGVMQIMPATQAELGVKDPFDPWDSIRHGAKYTKQMLDHSDGDVETALGKYNAGPNGDLSNPETVKYVRDVTDRWDNYRKQRWSHATPKASSAKPAPADTGTDAGQVPSFGELPETTPPSLTDAPDRRANAPDEAPDTGYLDAAKQGILSPLTGAAQTYRAATTGKPGESAAPRIAAAEPMTLHDLKNPRLLGEKALYEFSASFPELSAFAIGSIPGGGPTTPTGVATGSVGAALAHTVTSFGPIFGEELKASPNDPDAAFNRAYLKTGIGAVATGLGYYTFGRFNPFSNALKNLAFQTFGLQPVIGMAEHEATNVVDHKPAGQGVLEEYPGQVMGGVTTLAGFEGAKLGYHGVRAGIDALRKPVANPLLANNIGQQINAAGQAQNGQTPPTAPPEPPPAPPAPPTASPTGEAPPAPPVPGAGTRTPQETLAIIAGGGDPAATPPPPPPAPPVAPPAAPPVAPTPAPPPPAPPTGEVPPRPTVRTTGQIQIEDGIGYNHTVRVQNQEREAQAAWDKEYGGAPPAPEAPPASAPTGGYAMLDPSDLRLDPKRFQYKEADPERGLTGALRGVDRWEPALASPITAWQDNDGNLFVVNGHQRADLAQRAKAGGQPDVQVPARIFREADGFTPDYMRTLGAYQNIAEGTGTAIDAAKVLRGAGSLPAELRLPDLPPASQLVRDARGLAGLSDQAFGVVVNGAVPPAYAAHVGGMIRDPAEQMAALQMLAHARPDNTTQARLMVEDMRNSGFLKDSQSTLFGEEDFAKSLVPQRAKVLDGALRILRKTRNVFGAAVAGNETLTAAGNTLDAEGNVRAKTENERLIDSLQRNATMKGPVSDALSAAAADLAAGKPAATVISQFLARARTLERSGQDASLQHGNPDSGTGPAGSGAKDGAGKTSAPVEEQGGLFGPDKPPKAALVEPTPPEPKAAPPEPKPAPSPEPAPAEAEAWWKHHLTAHGRSQVLDAAGLKWPNTTGWQYLPPDAKAALWKNRAAAGDFAPPTEKTPPVVQNPGTPPEHTPSPKPAPVESTPPRPAGYGENNKVFTADLAAKARERLRAKLNGSTLNSGFDPELMLDGLTLAGYHVEAGARSFAAYSKAMLTDLGEAVRPFLAQFYTAVRMHPGFDTTGMDDHAAVHAATSKQEDRPSTQAAAPPAEPIHTPHTDIGPWTPGNKVLYNGYPFTIAKPPAVNPSLDGHIRVALSDAKPGAFTYAKPVDVFIYARPADLRDAHGNPMPPLPTHDARSWPISGSVADPLLVNNAEHLREQHGPDGLLSRVVAQMLHEGDAKPAGVARVIDAKRMQWAAEMVFGGRLADNAFGRDRMYDAMETGVNRYIAMHPERFAPTGDVAHAKAAAEALAEIKNRLPTQTVRAGDKDKLQQFSTPPEYAFAAAWAANLKPTDHVLEPSAGNGGLLVHALTAGVAETTGNEISEQRLTNLKDQGFTRVTGENAEQLHNILPETIRPTAVIMNPPFSSAGDRMAGKMILGVGAQHIEQALQRLEPGGRLVAIVGRGMSMDAPAFKGWWSKIGSQYDVRANVGVGGGIYRKYGTTFATRVLVIDKVPPSGRAVVRNEVEGIDGLIDKLSGVRDDRPATGSDRGAGEQVAGEPVSEDVAVEGADAGQSTGIIRDPTGDLGAGGAGEPKPGPDESVGPVAGGSGEPDVSAAGPGTEAHPPGDAIPVEQSEHEPGGTAGQPEQRPDDGGKPAGGGGAGAGDHTRPDGSDVRLGPPAPELVKTGIIIPDTEHGGELTECVYEPYKPQRVQIEGARAHPGALVQSAAMASVLPPAPKYNTAIPTKLITSGALSDAQLESIIYAGEAHSQMLEPDNKGVVRRKGFFIGDGTGVGKGRETAGIILDNWVKGNRKAVWVSDKMALGNDAKRDWAGLGGDPAMILPHNKVKAGGGVTHKEGVLFTSYDTLRSEEKIKTTKLELTPGASVSVKVGDLAKKVPGVLLNKLSSGTWNVELADGSTLYVSPEHISKGAPQSRVDQIVSWLGKDFDGVIAFDEAHNMANAVVTAGTRGRKAASLKAMAGIELQDRLPNARVVYVSATGATEVTNLAYANRLGLWGKGTAFADRDDFISKIGSGGVAAMELVARDMKSLGQYMARSLSYDGVEYDRILHPLNEDQTVMYDKIADAWQMVMANFEKAIETTDSGGKGGVTAGIKSAFWGGHQRFFNQLITSMQMPSVIEGVERDIAEGRQAVLQLVNTNEAATDRALEKNRTETGGDDLEELDLSPKAQLLQLVEKAFPTRQYEKYVDDDGNERVRPVSDAKGNPVHSREALAAKAALLDDLATLRVPDGPLDLLFNHFGPDAVSEVTGRKQRVVNRADESGVVRRVEEKRGDQDNIKEAKAFQDAKKKILVFSEAGGTGRSYHAAIDAPSADNRRSHYLVQAGWRADKAVQGFGRTHRTNQASAPIFHLVTTDLEGQKRFISSIARRLGQLGALTKGERKTGDQGMFGLQDNLEADEAKASLTQLYRDVVDGKVDGITDDTTFKKMGLSLIDPTTGGLRRDLPPMTQFLNRLLSLRSGEQNQLFDAFNTRFADTIDRAQQAGTLDAGTETLRADKITKKSDQTVYTDAATGAETKHVHLETHTKNHPVSFDDIEAGQSRLTGNQVPVAYVRNTRSGRISAIADTTYAKVEATGQVTEHYRVANPLEGSFQVKGDIAKAIQEKRIELINDRAEARKLWEAQVAATPAYKSADLHMITGAVLPIWDRLAGTPKIYRLQTDTGERLLGRVVDNKEIANTLRRLGAEGQKVTATPEEVGQKILEGSVATLANGWTIKRSLVAGQQRLEIKGWGYQDVNQLKQDGVFSERINSDVRLFIPPDRAGEIIERITRRRPVTELTGSDGEQYARRAPKQDAAQAAAPSTEDRTADHPELHAAMSQMLRFVGIPETVGLKLVDRITKGGPNGADAVYDKGLITYALDTAAGHAPTKLWHEAIHALMDPALGLLNDGHRRALLTGADRWLHDGKRGVERRAELKALGYTDAQMREEAVARMGEEALARGLEPKSLLGGAIIRMRNFARGLGQVFRGQGWTTAEDVFNGLMRGDRALPKAKEAMRASASAPPRPQAPEPEDGSEKPAARTFDEAFPPEDTQSLSDVLTAQRDEKFAARRSPLQVGRDAADDIARMFSPTTRGPDAKQTELTIRGRGAKLAQSSAQAGHALEQWRHVVGRLPEAEQYEITDRMERGLPMTDPALQPVARTIRAELDRVTRAIQSLPGNRLAQAKVDYMGRIYANYPEWSAGQQTGAQAQANGLSAAVGAGVSKRPLRGSGNFLKQRSFDFLSDARQAGLVPVTSNPLEMQTLKLREMWKFYHGMKLAEELKAQGIARWVKQSDMGAAHSAGLAELNDRIFNPKVPVPGGQTEYGKWMAPEAAARLFNNYVSEGLRGNTLYDMTRSLGAALNSTQLSLSGFHATFIGLDTMTSRVARGLENFAHGEFGRGIINTALGFSPHNVARSIARGSKLKAAYLDPMNADPQWKKLVDLLNAGGGRISMDQFYRSNVSGSFFKNMNDMKNPGGVWREARIMAKDSPLTLPLDMAGRIIETSMEPIMGQMVPRAKLGVFADMAEDWQRRNPLATPEETAAAMTKAWDSVDNRMGQLVYDNLFWPKITKDLAFISTRSVGWNLGTIRELGGGVVDTARAINAAAHLRSPEFTARMAYTLAMPLLTGMMGAVLTYAYTGAAPTSLLDYFYPPNGKPDGGRVSIPGYIKDVVSYLHAPVQTLLNKTHPLMSMASQIYQNRDYRGASIYDSKRDNAWVAYPEYLLNTALPFTVQAMRKNAAQGTSGLDQALAFFGVQPAPASIIHPEKQEKYQARQDKSAYRARMKEDLWRPFSGN